MKLIDYIESAQTNLRRAKARTILTVLAIFIGAFTLALSTAAVHGLQSFASSQIEGRMRQNVINVRIATPQNTRNRSDVPEYISPTENAPRPAMMSLHEIQTIQSAPHVEGAYPDLRTFVDYIQLASGGTKYFVGIEPLYPDVVPRVSAGKTPNADDLHSILLPYPYVKALGAADPNALLGQSVVLQVSSADRMQHWDFPFAISGILPDTASTMRALVSYQIYNQIAHAQQGSDPSFDFVTVVMNPGVTKTDRKITKQILEAKGFRVQDFDDTVEIFKTTFTVINLSLGGFAALSLLAATLGIVNTLLMAVFERTQEIGLMKSMGMQSKGIFGLFLVEAVSIGFWGGLLGVLSGRVIGVVANFYIKRLVPGTAGSHLLLFSPLYMAGIVFLTMAIGLVAGTLPAYRASQLDPIEALRRE